jgi:MFS family permease
MPVTNSSINNNRWIYVWTGFCTQYFGVTTMYVVFNFLSPIFQQKFGWSQLATSFSMTLFWLADGVSLVSLGVLIDRFGIKVAVPYVCLFGCGIMALAAMPNSLAVLYVLFTLIGLGCGGAAPTVYSVVITAWFEHRRGLALGIITVGLGLGGATLPFVASYAIHAYDWRVFVLGLGFLCAVLPALAYTFILRMPAWWENNRTVERRTGKAVGIPLSDVLRHRHVWLLSLAVLLASAATIGTSSKAMAILTSRSLAGVAAVSVFSSISVASIGTRLCFGALLDYVFAPALSIIIFVLCAIGMYLLATTSRIELMYFGAICVGMSLGAETDIIAYTLSRYVPRQLYGRTFGFMLFVYAVGGASGTFILSWFFGATGSYLVGLEVIIGLVIAAAACFLFMGPYRFNLDGSEMETPKNLAMRRAV